MARPKFKPTEENRKTVSAMASYGIPQERICQVIGCSLPTLHKYFRHDLDVAATKATAMVAQTCYQMATSGRHPAATFFWLKTRGRWRETDRPELADHPQAPLTIQVRRMDRPARTERIALDKPRATTK